MFNLTTLSSDEDIGSNPSDEMEDISTGQNRSIHGVQMDGDRGEKRSLRLAGQINFVRLFLSPTYRSSSDISNLSDNALFWTTYAQIAKRYVSFSNFVDSILVLSTPSCVFGIGDL